MSAPHMHATCLEHLKLRPGHHFLDIGSGCGIMTAAAAYLVHTHAPHSFFSARLKPCLWQYAGVIQNRL